MFSLLKVHSDLSLTIREEAEKRTLKFCIGGLKFPVIDNEDPLKDEPGGYEAREFLRRRLTGKKFNVKIEENLKNQQKCGKILLEDKDLAFELIEKGFAKPLAEDKEFPSRKKYESHHEALNSKGNIPYFIARKYTTLKSESALEATLISCSLSVTVESLTSLSVYKVFSEKHNIFLHIRPSNIDIPEIGKNFKDKTLEFLSDLLLWERATVTISEFIDSEAHGRLALCSINLTEPLEKTLIEKGFAVLSDQAYFSLSNDVIESYEMLSQQARENQLGLWFTSIDYLTLSKLMDHYSGLITEVLRGDLIRVRNHNSYKNMTFKIANIEVPTIDNFFGFEAREFVRKNFIGKFVNCIIIGTQKGNLLETEIFEATVYLERGETLAKIILEQGLGSFVKNKGENEKTDVKLFQELLSAEQQAKEKNLGLHSLVIPVIPIFNQILENKNVVKAQEVLTSYHNNPTLGRILSGIVEQVHSGSAFEIRVDSLSVIINFYLAGVVAVSEKTCAEELKKFAEEAYKMAYDSLMHKDVKIDFQGMNKNGSFFGNLFLNKENFAYMLLSRGLAYTITARNQNNFCESPEFEDAEFQAREAKEGLWSTGINLFEEKIQHSSLYIKGQVYEVTVSEVSDEKNIYVQLASEEEVLEGIKEEINDIVLSQSLEKIDAEDIVPGKTYCLAQFSEDLEWFRAKIKTIKKLPSGKREYDVFYIDYGNSEALPIEKLRKIPLQLLEKNPLATKVSFHGINIPPLDHEVGEEALEHLSDFILDIKLEMKVFHILEDLMQVELRLLKGSSIAELMLAKGFARVKESYLGINPDWDKAQKKAAADQLGIWSCDDQLSDEEEGDDIDQL